MSPWLIWVIGTVFVTTCIISVMVANNDSKDIEVVPVIAMLWPLWVVLLLGSLALITLYFAVISPGLLLGFILKSLRKRKIHNEQL